MKVYILDFQYFSGIEWKEVDVKIIATSKIQLMKSFISETDSIISRNEMPNSVRKKVWKRYRQYIKERPLVFPIVFSKTS